MFAILTVQNVMLSYKRRILCYLATTKLWVGVDVSLRNGSHLHLEEIVQCFRTAVDFVTYRFFTVGQKVDLHVQICKSTMRCMLKLVFG